MKPIWPSYQPFLSHPDEAIRAWALQRMALSSPQEALTAARALLHGPSNKLTTQAAQVLSQRATQEDQALLQGRLSERLDDHERHWVMKALCLSGVTNIYQEYYTNDPNKTLLFRLDFWEQWAAVDPAGCTRAILARWSKPQYKNEELVWTLALCSEATDATLLLKELRGAEDKENLALALLHRAGAEDLFAAAPAETIDHAHSCLLLLAEEMGMPSSTPQEQKVFAAIKKKSWENAIKLALAELPVGELRPEWAELWTWAKALRAALLAQPRGGSAEARLAFALCVGMRRLLFVNEHFSALSLTQLVELRSMISTSLLAVIDAEIIAQWQGASEEEKAHALEDFIEQVSEELDSNDTLPALLQRLPGVPCGELLLALSVSDFETTEHSSPYFKQHPEELKQLTEEHLGKGDGEVDFSLLNFLESSCDEWPTALLLERREGIGDAQSEMLYQCLMERADPAMMSMLRDEWRPEEIEIAETLTHIAKLTGEALPKEIVEDIDEHFRKNQEEKALQALRLECLSCHRVYRYRVHKVALSQPEAEWDGVSILEQITCKKCGAQDQYHPTLGCYEYLSSVAAEDEELPEYEQRVIFGSLALSDGSVVRTWSEGFLRLKERVEQEPESSEAWMRLGNYLRTGQKPNEAALAYQKCLLLAPGSYEALFSLATCYLLLQEKPAEGLPILREAVKGFASSRLNGDEEASLHLCSMLYNVAEKHEGALGLRANLQKIVEGPRGELKMQNSSKELGVLNLKGLSRWEALEALLGAGVLLELELVDEIPAGESEFEQMLGAISVREPAKAEHKVGRNEPCPCGSGQKYKKCHGK